MFMPLSSFYVTFSLNADFEKKFNVNKKNYRRHLHKSVLFELNPAPFTHKNILSTPLFLIILCFHSSTKVEISGYM
jgi:hypothetical protein